MGKPAKHHTFTEEGGSTQAPKKVDVDNRRDKLSGCDDQPSLPAKQTMKQMRHGRLICCHRSHRHPRSCGHNFAFTLCL